jgi:hypothetical protein
MIQIQNKWGMEKGRKGRKVTFQRKKNKRG